VLTSDGSVWTSTAIPAPTIADGSVTDPKISNGLVADTTYYPLASGFGFINNTNTSTLVKVASYRCLRGGTFNFRFRITNFFGTTTVGSRVYVDGVAVGSLISGSIVAPAFRTDTHTSISVDRNQIVDLYFSNANSATGTALYNPQFGTTGNNAIIAFSNVNENRSSDSDLPI
jgi:hypothetical protein